MTSARRAVAAVRYRASTRWAYVDLHRHPADTVLLAGSRRSGTTWLAEVLNHRRRYRVMFEPFHPVHCRWARSRNPEWAKYVEPDFDDPKLEQMCSQLWSGRVRDPWIDKHNTKRVASRRLIKSVESTNLLPWMTRRWPDLKVVYLLRHPFAASESQLVVPFNDDGLTDLRVLRSRPRLVDGVCEGLDGTRARELVETADEPLQQHVVRWCLENSLPLRRLSPQHTHVVFYEDLVRHTRNELARLEPFVGAELGEHAVEQAMTPSQTDFRNRAQRFRERGESPDTFVSEWQEIVSPRQIDLGLEVLRAFELDHLYGDDPFPLVPAEAVLSTTRRRGTSTPDPA